MSKMNRKVYQLEAIEVIVTMPSYQNPGQNQLTGKGTGNTVTLRTGRSGHYARTAITSTYQPRRNTQAVQSAHRQAGFVQPTRVRDTAIQLTNTSHPSHTRPRTEKAPRFRAHYPHMHHCRVRYIHRRRQAIRPAKRHASIPASQPSPTPTACAQRP